MKQVLVWVIASLSLVGSLLPTISYAATIPTAHLPTPRAVTQTADQITLVSGCQTIDTRAPEVTVPTGAPYHIIPANDSTSHFLCTPGAVAQLTPRTGDVAGLSSVIAQDAQAQAAAGSPTADSTLNRLLKAFGPGAGGSLVLSLTAKTTAEILILTASAIGSVGAIILGFAGNMLGYVLARGEFLSSDIVRTGWPFMQGLANLGFILALLYIAFATTLQLDVGGGIRKVLPRLLVAALLINFSLVLTTLVIDASRLAMATLMLTLGGHSDLGNLGTYILASTKLPQTAAIFSHSIFGLVADVGPVSRVALDAGPLTNVASAILMAITIWAYAIIMIYLLVAFFFRYVILLFLLVVSPLAFLSFALPNTKSLAEKWWQTFIRWVLFGPAALLILVFIIKLREGIKFVPDSIDNGAILNALANLMIVGVLLITAATAGKYVGAVGGTLAVQWAGKGVKRARKMAYGAVAKPTGIAVKSTKAVTKAVTKPIRKRVGQNITDFRTDVEKAVRKKYGKNKLVRFAVGPERDKDGKIKKGQPASAGQAAARVLTEGSGILADKKSEEQVTTARELGQEIRANGRIVNYQKYQDFVTGGGFRNERAATQFEPDHLIELVRADSDGRVMKDIVNRSTAITVNWTDSQKIELVQAVAQNGVFQSSQVEERVAQYDKNNQLIGYTVTDPAAKELARLVDKLEETFKKQRES